MSRCKVCRKDFTKRSMTHKICDSTECAIAYGETLKAQRIRKEAKQDRVKTKARLLELKPRSYWLAQAQKEFNAYIRERDKGVSCISCGRRHDGQIHAGHYLSTGARPSLRFAESNCHAQCQPCNTHLHGNLVLYRASLIAKVGLAEVERLEGECPPVKWSSNDLKAIRDKYRTMTKDLKDTFYRLGD